MSIPTIFNLASQGMTAQRERLEATASNLANANTTRTPEGGPYRRRDVVFETIQVESPLARDEEGEATAGGRASVIAAPRNDVVLRYMPGHPDANADGYVAFPNVDPIEETVNMLSASRSFEANATVFN